LSGKLQELGFVPSKADTSLFFYNHGKHKIFILVYVDDIIIASSSSDAANALIQSLHKDFALKDLGDLQYFLGIEVSGSKAALLLKQEGYATDILKRVHMSNCKLVSTPLTPSKKY
jgi:hypothetical protein